MSDWEELVQQVQSRYHLSGSIHSFLFLIGLQESGKGFRSFSREEKTELILLGQKVVSGTSSINTEKDSLFESTTYEDQLKAKILRYFHSF